MREMIGNKSMHMVKANEHITDILHRIKTSSLNLIEHLKSYHNVIKHFKMLQ